jgi:hypothetical protein
MEEQIASQYKTQLDLLSTRLAGRRKKAKNSMKASMSTPVIHQQ